MYISNLSRIIVKLLQLPGFGPKSVENLITNPSFFSSELSENELLEIVNESIKTKKIRVKTEYSSNEFSKAFDKGQEIIDKSISNQVSIVTKYDDDFPSCFKAIISINNDKVKDVSPLIMSLKGNKHLMSDRKGIAIIGTRNPTKEGVEAGEFYGSFFAEKGFNIVSGLAIGCDTSAHKGALMANGATTAVLAHGLHTIYPKENRELADKIVESKGLLISEYLWGTNLVKNFLVERDRLQAAAALATIVIQTGEKGGTMHAVKTTIDNNKILATVQYKDEKVMEQESVRGNSFLMSQKNAFRLRKPEYFLSYISASISK